MTTRTPLAALTLAASIGISHAGMVVFENTGSLGALDFYDPNFGNVIFGQSLDITRAAGAQPKVGETPAGSVFFMHIRDLNGDFIWIGTGSVTNTVESTDPTRIPIPLAPEGIDYFGPQSYGDGESIDGSANFVEGWRPVHGYNDLTGLPGVFTVDDTFTIGIEFEQGDGIHYGFASFDLSYAVAGGIVDVDIVPTFWGYNDVAGEAAVVIPSPAGVLPLLGLSIGLTRQRR